MAEHDRLRVKWERAGRALAKAVADAFPEGQRCAIIRERRGVPYYIKGTVAFPPSSEYLPTSIGVRTDSRGTVMYANYQDIRLEERSR